MLRKFFTTAIILAFISPVFAQDSTKKGNLTLSGSVDAYYRFDFHNAKDSGYTNNYTSFTNSHNSFELGMASLKADYSIGKVDGVVDLGFGRRADEFSYNDGGSTVAAVKQAYVSYAPSEHVKFTMGKWGTHVGYELLDAYLNRNYSMDYMFSYGPFFHTGLKADFTFGHSGIMVGVANPSDMVSASFAKKFFIGQFYSGSPSGKFKGYLNFVGGKVPGFSTNQFDLVLTGVVSDQFNIGYNGTIQTVKPTGGDGDSWWGSALYLNYDPCTAFGLTLRGEYFDDKKSVSAGAFGTSIFDVTLSGNIRIDNLTIIPEFRLDSSKDPFVFLNKTGDFVKSSGSFILGATYHF